MSNLKELEKEKTKLHRACANLLNTIHEYEQRVKEIDYYIEKNYTKTMKLTEVESILGHKLIIK